jgi:hypothetical protein
MKGLIGPVYYTSLNSNWRVNRRGLGHITTARDPGELAGRHRQADAPLTEPAWNPQAPAPLWSAGAPAG